MPQIREYTSSVSAQTDLPGRKLRGADFGSISSTAGEGLANFAEGLNKVAEQQEVTTTGANLARVRAKLTTELAEWKTSADPGDAEFSTKWSEHVQKSLEGVGEGVQTRAGRLAFQRESADLSAQFVAAGGLAQIEMAGQKAIVDYKGLLDANRNTLLADPTQFDMVRQSSLAALDNPEGTYAKMPAAKRLELRDATEATLALSAAQGVIRLSPELALKQLNEGRWDAYLDADKKFQLERAADQGIRGKEIEAERLRVARERAEKDARDRTMNVMLTKMYGEEGLSTKEVIADPTLEFSQKKTLLDMVERGSKPDPIRTNPETLMDLWARVHMPAGDPRKLTDEDELNGYFGKGLTISDINNLRAEIQGKRTGEGSIDQQLKKAVWQAAKSAITSSDPLLKLRDPKGDENFSGWLTSFLPEWDKQIKAGKSAIDLADPKSKDYIGRSISQYVRSPAQRMQDLIDAGNAMQDIGGVPSGAPTNATRTGKDKAGKPVYEVGGKWQYGDGKEYKP